MTALRNYGVHEMKVCKSVYRLSTGKKLASDDPAGAMIAAKLQARIRELGVIIRKTEEKQDMLNVAYGDTMGRQNILQRMRELTLSMANDTFSQAEKDIMAVEFKELAKEFGVNLFEKTGMEIIALDTVDSKGDFVFKKDDMVFLNGEWKKLSELEKAQEMNGEKIPIKTTTLTDYVDSMMKQNMSSASSISAFSSALSFRLERLQTEEENAIAALSRIEDIDIAEEIMEFVKEQILAQTSLAVAAQANALPEQVLKLLENIPTASNSA
jgi:flagellin